MAFPGARLEQGRNTWLGYCEGCHGTGVAGAPMVTDFSAWVDRIGKGKSTLYQHAIDGFFGPRGTMMPERGGNPKLTDEAIRKAVDYMVALAIASDERQTKRK